MDFKGTDEQDMIREMVRDFAETVLAPTVEHRDQTQTPPSAEWQQFLELGLQGVTVPEAYGGMPVDDISESIIVEELARVDPSFSVMYCVHVGLCTATCLPHAQGKVVVEATFEDFLRSGDDQISNLRVQLLERDVGFRSRLLEHTKGANHARWHGVVTYVKIEQ